MNLNLAGKSVIVTGGGSNIGRAISLAFAREATHLTVAEIDEGQGKKVAAEAQSLGAASATVVIASLQACTALAALMRIAARSRSVSCEARAIESSSFAARSRSTSSAFETSDVARARRICAAGRSSWCLFS